MALKIQPIRLPAVFHRTSGPRTRNNSIVPKFRKVSESQVASHQPTSPPSTSAASDTRLMIARMSAAALPAVSGCSLTFPHQGTDW